MNIKDNKELQELFENNSVTIRKTEQTIGRLPSQEELGTYIKTYVLDSVGELSVETTNTIKEDTAIAKNKTPLIDGPEGTVYNVWLVSLEKWIELYGIEPTYDEQPYTKIKTNRALLIDDNVLRILGSADGKSALIDVSWSYDGMYVYRGGYLVDAGYGITPDDFNKTYEKV